MKKYLHTGGKVILAKRRARGGGAYCYCAKLANIMATDDTTRLSSASPRPPGYGSIVPATEREPEEKEKADEDRETSSTLRRDVNMVDAIAMVVGGIIGSGIFITPASILEDTGSFGVSMMCWFAGMVIAICGGLCYIELSLLIPRTGAEYVYILQAYSFKNRNKWTELLGSLMAFLYTWSAIIIIRPTATSIIALTCTRYLTRPLYIDCDIPEGVLKCLTIAILCEHQICSCMENGARTDSGTRDTLKCGHLDKRDTLAVPKSPSVYITALEKQDTSPIRTFSLNLSQGCPEERSSTLHQYLMHALF